MMGRGRVGWLEVLVSGERGRYQCAFSARFSVIFSITRQISVILDSILTVSETECEIPAKLQTSEQNFGNMSVKSSKISANLASSGKFSKQLA